MSRTSTLIVTSRPEKINAALEAMVHPAHEMGDFGEYRFAGEKRVDEAPTGAR